MLPATGSESVSGTDTEDAIERNRRTNQPSAITPVRLDGPDQPLVDSVAVLANRDRSAAQCIYDYRDPGMPTQP
jgi:hypothetical protein